MTESEIARVAHEVNRGYCAALGDNSQPQWGEAPDWQKNGALLGVRLYTKDPDAGPQALHESWVAQKVAEGWVHGPVKNLEEKEHPCLVHFDHLPADQRAKDFIFRAVVLALKCS